MDDKDHRREVDYRMRKIAELAENYDFRGLYKPSTEEIKSSVESIKYHINKIEEAMKKYCQT